MLTGDSHASGVSAAIAALTESPGVALALLAADDRVVWANGGWRTHFPLQDATDTRTGVVSALRQWRLGGELEGTAAVFQFGGRRWALGFERSPAVAGGVLCFALPLAQEQEPRAWEIEPLALEVESLAREALPLLGDLSEPSDVGQHATRLLVDVALNEAIGLAQMHFVEHRDAEVLFRNVLRDMVAATGCERGFIADVARQLDGSIEVRTLITLETEDGGLDGRVVAGLFEMLGALQPLAMTRAAMQHMPWIGLVPLAIDNALWVPLRHGDIELGALGLANRPGGFPGEVIAQLTPLFTVLAELMHAWRGEQERERIASQLAEARRDVDRYFELTADLVCVITRDGLLRRVNPAAQRFLGLPSKEVARTTTLQSTHPDDRAATSAVLARLREGECLVDFESRLLDHAGEVHWIAWRAIADGEYVYCAGRQIDERKRFERELTQVREHAEAAAAAKGMFLATMSPELRTPLNGMLGRIDLLLGEPLPLAARDTVHTIREASEALLAIINATLEHSRLESGVLELERNPLYPRRLAASVQALLAASARTRGVALEIAVDAQVDDVLEGDVAKVRQVLLNLVGNALKFTPTGRVGVRVDAIASTARTQVLRLQVEDTGVGMTEAQRVRLFTPFVQGDASTSRRYGGTGLGLAISRQFVNRMGGTIAIRRSAPGAGTVLEVLLPLARVVAGQVMADAGAHGVRDSGIVQAAPLIGAPRVLVAEDNEINQRVLSRMLERLGCASHVVADGQTALDALGREEFDLVLMDWQMPVLDGRAATERIRAGEWGVRLPIVIVTASAKPGDQEACRLAGADGYLTKPIRLAALRDMLSRLLAPGARSGVGKAKPGDR